MFEMIATGSSLHAIKTTLDREGVPTPRGKGPWNKITIRRYLLSDLYKPHTLEELRTLGVAEEVLRNLDHTKRYGVWWFGVERVTTAQGKVKPRANASERPRRFKKQEDPIPVPVADAGIPREWVESARRYFETYRGWQDKAGRKYYELRGFVYCGVCGRKYTGY
jgi:hypothetical protein